uniref:C2H2-type domain-containing protein n=1 Tax=Mola mola TaxID=94237 RepID=A0A3Q3WU91_MOLML
SRVIHTRLHKYAPRITCQTCGRHFPSPRALAHHRRKRCHRLFKCTDCTLTFTKKNALLKHSFSHLGLLPYTCVRCRCHFRLAKLYRQHTCQPQRIHCVQHKKDTGCWERFDTSDELKKHAGAHQRVLKCAECGKGFRSALLLMSHMGGHAGEKPYHCGECGKCFTQSGALKIHTRIHTGERPFICSICGKGFSNRSGIRFHYRTAHGLAPEQGGEAGAGGAPKGSSGRGYPLGRPRTFPPASSVGLNTPNGPDKSSQTALGCRDSPVPTGAQPALAVLGGEESSSQSGAANRGTNREGLLYTCEDCGLRFKDAPSRNRHQTLMHYSSGGGEDEEDGQRKELSSGE